jgi:hypothetical protein
VRGSIEYADPAWDSTMMEAHEIIRADGLTVD